MKENITNFIISVYEKNYAKADAYLQDILNEKVKKNIKEIIKNKKDVKAKKMSKIDKKTPKKNK